MYFGHTKGFTVRISRKSVSTLSAKVDEYGDANLAPMALADTFFFDI